MIIETEFRRNVGGVSIVRLPKSSIRKCHISWCRLVERVELDLTVYGSQAWIGPLYRAGSPVDETTLTRGQETPAVVLEATDAEPMERGSRNAKRSRWRQLYILWQWNPQLGIWKELGRLEDMPLDAAPELRQLARRAIAQELWRDTETAQQAADRIHKIVESEWSQLKGDKRAMVVAILYQLLCTMMLRETERLNEEQGRRPLRDLGSLPHRRRRTHQA